MKIFVFDTETTWFINKKDPSLEAQPKIIQFAGIFWDLENWIFKEEKRVDILINPKMPIPFESSKVHHLYDIDVKNAPFIEDKIDEIMSYINDSDAIKWNWERFKYPKLWELHKKLFDEYFIWAHDAMTDVEATLRCFVELAKTWIIKIEKPQEAMTLF